MAYLVLFVEDGCAVAAAEQSGFGVAHGRPSRLVASGDEIAVAAAPDASADNAGIARFGRAGGWAYGRGERGGAAATAAAAAAAAGRRGGIFGRFGDSRSAAAVAAAAAAVIAAGGDAADAAAAAAAAAAKERANFRRSIASGISGGD